MAITPAYCSTHSLALAPSRHHNHLAEAPNSHRDLGPRAMSPNRQAQIPDRNIQIRKRLLLVFRFGGLDCVAFLLVFAGVLVGAAESSFKRGLDLVEQLDEADEEREDDEEEEEVG